MKNLVIALAAMLCVQTSFSQIKNIEYSAPFEEPEKGWRKVLQLTNGNTFLFVYDGKGGIDVSVYGADRKLKTTRSNTGEKWEPKEFKNTNIVGLYEIGGKPVIFLQQVIKSTPRLYRLIFDANTGAISNEEQISELQKLHAGIGLAMVWGNFKEPAFHVEKNPASDHYAVINFNSISSESDERISVKYYGVENGSHKVLSEAFYDAQGYKYINYVASFVDGNSLYLCAYGFNTKRSGGEDSRLILSRLDKAGKTFTHNKIEFTDDFQDTRGVMTYNPASGMLQMLTLTYLQKKSNMWTGTQTTTYLPLMTYIDPKTLQVVKAAVLSQEYASTRVKEAFGEKKPFSGMPQYMVVNKDNSTSVIVEEFFKTQQVNYGQTKTLSTQLGHIGITEFDMSGKETIGYAAKKAQKASGDMGVFNLMDRRKGKWSYIQPASLIGDNTPFFSFNYVNTQKGKYLIFNDFPENFGKRDKDKINEVDAASNMHTVYYELKNGLFEKHYLFGTPGGKDRLKFANIQSADVQDATNTYAVLMIDRDGKRKEAHIAWVTFE